MGELSIVIVNWNSRQFLNACLNSICLSLPAFPVETIVVDNASADGSVELVQKEFPTVRLIVNEANIGFAAANNQGAKSATGRYLLFLNPDTQVYPRTLAGALAFMEQHPETGIMGCRTLNPDGTRQATAFAFPTRLRGFAKVSGLNRFFKISYFTAHSSLRMVDYVQGSFLIIRKEIFDACGGFDEQFFLYAEEVDLCLRVRQSGLAVHYFPGVSIVHHGGGSSLDSLAALGHYIESSARLYQKYRTRLEQKKLRRALRAALRLRFFFEAVFSPWKFRTRKILLKKMIRELALTGDANTPGT